MFPEGSPDMSALLEQAAAMQQRLLAAQDELANAHIEGSAGGGLVQATVSGTGELMGLTIDPTVCDPNDSETLADLVLAAVRDASANAQQLAAEQMGGITGGFGGDVPGLDEGRSEGPSGFAP
ncbi:MAG: YbaB/EbfC family nucleoid-associated protein [Nocardioidaceae bacterium]